MHDCVPRISGHENDFCPWAAALNFIRELSAVYAGKHHVRQQQIEILVGL